MSTKWEVMYCKGKEETKMFYCYAESREDANRLCSSAIAGSTVIRTVDLKIVPIGPLQLKAESWH